MLGYGYYLCAAKFKNKTKYLVNPMLEMPLKYKMTNKDTSNFFIYQDGYEMT